jgi:hypothetical protein
LQVAEVVQFEQQVPHRPAPTISTSRERLGLESLEQIKYAVVERNGSISIIPADDARGSRAL